MSIQVGEYALIIKNFNGVLDSEKGTLPELQARKALFEEHNKDCHYEWEKFKVWIVQVIEN